MSGGERCRPGTGEVEVLAHAHAVTLVGTREDRLKGGDYGRVELTLHRLGESQSRDSARHCIPIRPIRRHRVVRVGNRNDSRDEGNLVAAKAVRVTVTVDTLVVMADDPRDLGVILDLPQNALANARVRLHLTPLFKGERA